jgi:hypothetical protein
MLTTICGKCEYEWPTDSGVQICPKCGNDGEIEGHVVRDDDPIMALAHAINDAPKVAEAPFALTSEVSRAKDARQQDLFS